MFVQFITKNTETGMFGFSVSVVKGRGVNSFSQTSFTSQS